MNEVQFKVESQGRVFSGLLQWELAKILEEISKKIADKGGTVLIEEEKTSYLFTSSQLVSIWNFSDELKPEETGGVEIFFNYTVNQRGETKKIISSEEMTTKLIQSLKILTDGGRGMEVVFGNQRFDCSLPSRTGWLMVSGMNYPPN